MLGPKCCFQLSERPLGERSDRRFAHLRMPAPLSFCYVRPGDVAAVLMALEQELAIARSWPGQPIKDDDKATAFLANNEAGSGGVRSDLEAAGVLAA